MSLEIVAQLFKAVTRAITCICYFEVAERFLFFQVF